MSTKKHTSTSPKSKKKTSKRGGVRKKGSTNGNSWNKDSYASLNPDKNMARRLEDVQDVQQYLHLLNDEEKQFMAKFMDEYNNARMDFKDLSNNLHNTKDLKKACTDRINARNRCIYSIESAKGMLNFAGSDAELESMYYGNEESEEELQEDFIED